MLERLGAVMTAQVHVLAMGDCMTRVLSSEGSVWTSWQWDSLSIGKEGLC